MAIEQFVSKNFRPASLKRIQDCVAIAEEYTAMNLRLTLRQLFYQLVARNLIANQYREYKNLGNLISDARLAGLMDWEAIEDRIRLPYMSSHWPTAKACVQTAAQVFRLDRWEGQDRYVELGVEKDALGTVLLPIAQDFHVHLNICRGYNSTSALYEMGRRFREAGDAGLEGVFVYIGDHDPSGEDMVRDIYDRMIVFGAHDVQVHKLALTLEQVHKYKLPPNQLKRKHGKISDSRAPKYAAQHGDRSWEVDALPPAVLNSLIRSTLEALVDRPKMDAVIAAEVPQRERILAMSERL